jgi:hypothetical protein
VSCMVLRRLIRSPAPALPSRVAWPVGETFKTRSDVLVWDQSQARTFGAICRHTPLTMLVGTSNYPPPWARPEQQKRR